MQRSSSPSNRPASFPDAPTQHLQAVPRDGDRDPLVQLVARLEHADADVWLQGLAVAGARPIGALDELVHGALQLAEQLAAGTEPMPAVPSELAAVWMLLRSKVPAMAERCTVALDRWHRAGNDLPGASAVRLAQRVGAYELGELLGEGSSGSVFRARDRRDGSEAAVKVLRVAWASHEQVERFRRESQVTAQLQHPCIVRVLDSGVEAHVGIATPFIAYELVAGRPFVEAMAGQPLATVLVAFQRVCEAIEYAHGRGILHRDIKSANVLVDAAGMPHVLDFGVALLVDAGGARMTRAGEVLGTLSAMSPEQASARPLDARSDVYALGALLFEALSRQTPHRLDGLRDQEALVVVASAPARSLARVCSGVREDVATVVDTALAFVAADRYPSVTALLADVRRLLRQQPIAAARPTARQLLRTFVVRHRRLALLGAAVACGAIALVSSLFLAWRQSMATTVAIAAAERSARDAADRCRTALRLVVQAAAPMVEAAPTKGEMHDQLVALLEEALHEAKAGLGSDDASAEVLASLHDLAGDLAWRGDEARVARRHRQLAVEQWRQAGAARALDHARALVKLGDIDQLAAPALALACYEQAHAVFAGEALMTGATLVARDELGWSFERLGGFAWANGRRGDSFALAQQRLVLAEELLASHPDAARRYQLASALAHLIVYAREEPALSPYTDAQRREFAQRASAAALDALHEHPSRKPFLGLAVRAHGYLATECRDVGDFVAERAALECAAELADDFLQQDPFGVDVWRLAILAHRDLGLVCARLGDSFAGQRELYRAAELGERALSLVVVAGISKEEVAGYRAAARQMHDEPARPPAPVPR